MAMVVSSDLKFLNNLDALDQQREDVFICWGLFLSTWKYRFWNRGLVLSQCRREKVLREHLSGEGQSAFYPLVAFSLFMEA